MKIDIENLPKEIKEEDCVFTDNMDRIFTHLILMDYDWMHYRIQAEIPVEDRKILYLEFLYVGMKKCSMIAEMDDKRIEYRFSSDIYDKYLEKYLIRHTESIHDTYAFSGEDIVLDFYKEVMENHLDIIKENVDSIIIPPQ